MAKRLRLYWLRETGCDTGTPIEAEELDAPLRQRVMELTGKDRQEIAVYLPFMDRRECRRRAEVSRAMKLERSGDTIRAIPATCMAELRDRAAMLVALDPAWRDTPEERDAGYFPAWQQTSLALQKAMRKWIPEMYFRDPARYEDREGSYPLIVYEASRLCFGRARTEFTYELADPETLPAAFRMIGQSMQRVLAEVETRLRESGRPELARRYAPVWHQDILNAVKKRPKRLLELLGDEAALINAVIDLGTDRRMSAVKPFAKAACAALRNMYREDMRVLALRALEEATGALTQPDTIIAGVFQGKTNRAARIL
jgi:hypothetical protein